MDVTTMEIVISEIIYILYLLIMKSLCVSQYVGQLVSKSSLQTCEIGVITIILQVVKLILRKVKSHAQDHTAGK